MYLIVIAFDFRILFIAKLMHIYVYVVFVLCFVLYGVYRLVRSILE